MHGNANMPLKNTVQCWTLVLVVLLAGCSSREEKSISGADCSLSQIGWRKLTFDPPSRVITWRIRLDGPGVDLNNRRMSRQDAANILAQSSDLRPSPYAIIEFDRSDNCGDVFSLASTISRRFQCERNYCFYLTR